jgi:hypothetical protein
MIYQMLSLHLYNYHSSFFAFLREIPRDSINEFLDRPLFDKHVLATDFKTTWKFVIKIMYLDNNVDILNESENYTCDFFFCNCGLPQFVLHARVSNNSQPPPLREKKEKKESLQISTEEGMKAPRIPGAVAAAAAAAATGKEMLRRGSGNTKKEVLAILKELTDNFTFPAHDDISFNDKVHF